MAYQQPKTNWTQVDGVTDADMNRIEENIRVVAGRVVFGAATYTGNTYTVSGSPYSSLTSLTNDVQITIKVGASNTAVAPQLSLNNTGPKPIVKANGAQIPIGFLKVDQYYILVYNGAAWQLVGSSDIRDEGGTIAGNVAVNGTLSTTGAIPTPGTITSGNITVNGGIVTTGQVWVGKRSQYGDSSTLSMPIGDSDSGINWAGDGSIELWSNGVVVGKTEGGTLKIRNAQDGTFRGIDDLNKVIVASNSVKFSAPTQQSQQFAATGSTGYGTNQMLVMKFIPKAVGEFRVYWEGLVELLSGGLNGQYNRYGVYLTAYGSSQWSAGDNSGDVENSLNPVLFNYRENVGAMRGYNEGTGIRAGYLQNPTLNSWAGVEAILKIVNLGPVYLAFYVTANYSQVNGNGGTPYTIRGSIRNLSVSYDEVTL
ncbi:hypothetical protein D1872_68470 [compost metagenome]